MYEWLQTCRLATVIDSGTIKWVRKVYLWFQLADFKTKPKDESLPDYCVYAKLPYGWLINNYIDNENGSLLKALGYKEWSVLDFLLDNVGKKLKLNIFDNEYKGKIYPNIASEWHEPFEWELDIEWGTELKTFKITDSMTKADVDALWFENKYLKTSDEYAKLKTKEVTEEEVEDLF